MTNVVFLKFNHPNSAVLNLWLNLFDSPNCKVTQAQDGNYCLTACRFERISRDEVSKSAENLITMMTAFAKIGGGDKYYQTKESDEKGVSINSVGEQTNDRLTVYIDAKPIILYSNVAIPKFEALDKNSKPISQERQGHWYDFFLDQCDDWIDDTVIFKALSYFAENTSERIVRLTYEAIKNDEGGEYELLNNNDWIKDKELSAFTRGISHANSDYQPLHDKSSVMNYKPKPLVEQKKSLLKSF